MAHAETDQLTETFKRALDRILARVFVCTTEPSPSLGVAYSGGLDSSVLLDLACKLAAERGMALHAFHVHHGLSPNADAWLAHCEAVCKKKKITFDARKVHLAKDAGLGVEALARIARYAALGEMCRTHRVPILLTAHHQDDQAETVLLQMLRGAGLAGMSGMEEVGTAPDLLKDPHTLIARPLLSLRRADLAAWAAEKEVTHIEDESNLDLHHPRNALRKEVLPLLAKHFPAYQSCLARGAQHAQAAQRLLVELAEQDMAACVDAEEHINATVMEGLSADRKANLLRHWLAQQGMRPPSTAWLEEALSQLLGARDDAQACVILGDQEVRRYRNRIKMKPMQAHTYVEPIIFQWQGEADLSFPAFGGSLHFDMAVQGLAPDWLRHQTFRLQYRAEAPPSAQLAQLTQKAHAPKLKLSLDRPSKGLKAWYQERDIPAWERLRLPLLYTGDALLFAAGIGQDCRHPVASPGVTLRWSGD